MIVAFASASRAVFLAVVVVVVVIVVGFGAGSPPEPPPPFLANLPQPARLVRGAGAFARRFRLGGRGDGPTLVEPAVVDCERRRRVVRLKRARARAGRAREEKRRPVSLMRPSRVVDKALHQAADVRRRRAVTLGVTRRLAKVHNEKNKCKNKRDGAVTAVIPAAMDHFFYSTMA